MNERFRVLSLNLRALLFSKYTHFQTQLSQRFFSTFKAKLQRSIECHQKSLTSIFTKYLLQKTAERFRYYKNRRVQFSSEQSEYANRELIHFLLVNLIVTVQRIVRRSDVYLVGIFPRKGRGAAGSARPGRLGRGTQQVAVLDEAGPRLQFVQELLLSGTSSRSWKIQLKYLT